ncbi:MAG: hypothetical protein Q7J78_07860 [Clostridiales bacterium]|nr:hypothetical protein [Clostridiales bacterium]
MQTMLLRHPSKGTIGFHSEEQKLTQSISVQISTFFSTFDFSDILTK